MRLKLLSAAILVSSLIACGGGGTETTTVVTPDKTTPDTTSPDTTEPPITDIEVPQDFDFSNFQTLALTFTVPGDLVGQIDYKIAGSWNGQLQDLYIGRGFAGQERTVDINIPTALDSVRIEYMAFDKASGTAQVKIEEVNI